MGVRQVMPAIPGDIGGKLIQELREMFFWGDGHHRMDYTLQRRWPSYHPTWRWD
ncbi:MAG TPA: hypothetical protein VGO47_07955 [Chlamydiales bacterium]|jgi:hypothetical protein|nr:hypothetical protein [Chlamydiales bacterium]